MIWCISADCRSSPVRQTSLYDSPILSRIPRSSSIGSESGQHDNVVMVPVAVTLAAMVCPQTTNPVPSFANVPSAAALTSTVHPAATVMPSAGVHHPAVLSPNTLYQLPSASIYPSAAMLSANLGTAVPLFNVFPAVPSVPQGTTMSPANNNPPVSSSISPVSTMPSIQKPLQSASPDSSEQKGT